MRKVKKSIFIFDDELQLHLDFGENSGFIVHPELHQDDEDSKKKYEQELNKTISNIIKLVSSVS